MGRVAEVNRLAALFKNRDSVHSRAVSLVETAELINAGHSFRDVGKDAAIDSEVRSLEEELEERIKGSPELERQQAELEDAWAKAERSEVEENDHARVGLVPRARSIG